MARTTYQAPGVYVEEVPSAQQPIEGVGTNTVGFIGVVKNDYVYCPGLNDAYDPATAQAALIGRKNRGKGEAAEAAKNTLNAKIRALEEDRKKLDDKLVAPPKDNEKELTPKQKAEVTKEKGNVESFKTIIQAVLDEFPS